MRQEGSFKESEQTRAPGRNALLGEELEGLEPAGLMGLGETFEAIEGFKSQELQELIYLLKYFVECDVEW